MPCKEDRHPGSRSGNAVQHTTHDGNNSGCRKTVKLPVTVKTRLGWDENSKNIVEIAERLQDVGSKPLPSMDGPGHSFTKDLPTGP